MKRTLLIKCDFNFDHDNDLVTAACGVNVENVKNKEILQIFEDEPTTSRTIERILFEVDMPFPDKIFAIHILGELKGRLEAKIEAKLERHDIIKENLLQIIKEKLK